MDSGAADEPVSGRDEVKGVGGDRGDASVVADDPGQGRPGQSYPLPCAEDAWILVPQSGYFKGRWSAGEMTLSPGFSSKF